MLIRRIALALTVAAATALTGAVIATGQASAAGVTKVSNTVDVRCAFLTYSVETDWYFPGGTPTALVYLQHGFSRGKANMRALAERYAEAGMLVMAPSLPSADIFGCTVNNIGNNTPFLNNVADLFGKANDPNDKLGRGFADARAKANRPGLTLPTSYVLSGHSAGGEAAAYVANRLRTTYPSQFARAKALILLDPVKSPAGSNMATALTGLNSTTLPIYAVSSPPYLANSDANGTVELTNDVDRAFLGVRLTTGCHCDAEGASTDALCTLTSGTPQAQNVATLQTLAVAWATDAVAGMTSATYYPGGAYYQGQLNAGVIQTLSGV